MVATFKVLSLLLSYPTREIQDGAGSLAEALRNDGLLSERSHQGVYDLIDQLASRDLYDLQERYVTLFDRTRSLSLHLFEHIHGEGRDRGQAMVDLQTMYESHGLAIDARELPDFVPLFLEFLSQLDPAEARDLLAQPLDLLKALEKRLRKRDSVYAAVFRALVKLAAAQPDEAGVQAILENPDEDPDDLEAVDRAWEEQAVLFGPGTEGGDADCPRMSSIVDRINAADGPTGSTGHG